MMELDKLHSRPIPAAPFSFTSGLCRENHFRTPLYLFWCHAIKEKPRFHRKQWEFVFIMQSLFERGVLSNSKSGLGFGVGQEPLPALFASQGVQVLATDLDTNKAIELGWSKKNQHSASNLDLLNNRGICPSDTFHSLVRLATADMNNLPTDIGKFDFCWSSCALEHLGSLKNGLDFIRNSLNFLHPGGIAVHTTEFNISSNDDTLDNNTNTVIYRKQDIEKLVKDLEKEGHYVEPVDFSYGGDRVEKYIDFPPYLHEPHICLAMGKYVTTSLGLIIHKAA